MAGTEAAAVNPYAYVPDANEMTSEQFNSTYVAPSPPDAPQAIPDVNDMSSAEFEAHYGQQAVTKPDTKPSPTTQPVTMLHYWDDQWKQGEVDVAKGTAMFGVITGDRKYEDAKSEFNTDNLKQLKAETGSVDSRLHWWGATRMVGSVINAGPFAIQTAIGSVKGALAGAGAGAAIGAGVGAVGGVETGPGELLTVPGGALIGAQHGFRIGMTAGGALVTGKIMSGQLYGDLREAGINHENAKVAAIAGGTVIGAISALQLGQLSSIGKKAAIQELSTEAGKGALGTFVKNYAKESGIFLTEMEAQSVTSLLSKTIAKGVQNHSDVMPTMDEWKQTLVDTFKQSLGPALVLPAGAHVAGEVAGKAGEVVGIGKAKTELSDIAKTAEFKQAVEDSTVHDKEAVAGVGLAQRVAQGKVSIADAISVINEGFNHGDKPTEAEIEKVKNTDTNTALDALSKPVTDETGKVTSEASGAPGFKVTTDKEGNAVISGLEVSNEKPVENAPATSMEVASTKSGPNTDLPSPELKARSDKIKADVKGIDSGIADLEAEKDARDVGTKKTRIDELNDHIDGLEKKLKNKQAENTDTTEVEAKLKDANKERNTLQKEVEAQGKKTSTVQIDAKLQDLYDKRDTLTTEHDLIHEGLLKPEEIGKHQGLIPVEKITQLRAKAVDRIIKGYEKGIREGTVDTKSAVRDVQTQVTALVRKSGLDAKGRAEFLSDIKNTQTPEQLERNLPNLRAKIEKFAEAENKRIQLKKLDRLINQTELKKSGKHPVGKFTADIQETLNHYREAAKDKEFLQKTADKINAKIHKGEPLTPEDHVKVAIAEQMDDIKSKSAADIQKTHDELKSILEGGRAENVEKSAARSLARQEIKEKAMESIQGNKPREIVPEDDETRAHPRKEGFAKWFRRVGHEISAWDKLMAITAQHDPSIAKGEKPELVKLMDHNTADRSYIEMRQEWHANLREKLTETLNKGHRDLLRKLEDDTRTRKRGLHLKADGTIKNLTLSKGQVIKLFMEMQDPALRAGLEEGNKYTFNDSPGVRSGFHPEGVPTTEELVNKILTPEDKAMADTLFGVYRKFYKETVNPFWRERYGTDLPFNEFYSPAKRRVEGKIVEDTSPGDRINQSTKPSSAISRVANSLALDPQDAVLSTYHHIDGWAHFIAHEGWDANVRAVFGDPYIRNVIESKLGKEVLENIKFQHDDLMRQHNNIGGATFKWFEDTRAKIATSMVGLRLVSFPKHIIAALSYLKDVGPVDWAAGVTHSILHPKEVQAILNESPIIRDRSSHLEREFLDAAKAEEFQPPGIQKALTHVSMLAVEKSSSGAKYGGGYALYGKVLRETGSKEQALTAVEKATKEHQFGGGSDTRSIFQKKHPWLSLFGTYPLKMAQIEMEAMRNVVNHPSGVTAKNAAKAAVIFHITLPVLSQFISTRLPISGRQVPKNDDDLYIAGFLGTIGELPLLGDLLKMTAQQGVNIVWSHKNKVWEPTTVLGRASEEFKKTGDEVVKTASDPNLENFAKVVDHAANLSFLLPRSAGGALPIPAATHQLEKMFGLDPNQKTKEDELTKENRRLLKESMSE